jgi:pyruvate formate lyase activating enzyme
MNKIRCEICPHECLIPEGKNGICKTRKNINGKISAESYGKITAIALDPIEKKPLRMFHTGKMILSVGSYGCNFRCGFCQNHEIAMPRGEINTNCITPAELTKMARETIPQGNIGVAYTYNEPLINYEYLLDCAKAVREAGLKNVLVTNGLINPQPLDALLPYIDAMNIDLKGFSEDFYTKLSGVKNRPAGGLFFERGDFHRAPEKNTSSERGVSYALETIKETIRRTHRHCHIEITTLIIPGENESHVEPIAQWLAGISPEIPLHLSRFFPRHNYADKASTPADTVHRLTDTARKYLTYVYPGNL